MYDYTILVLHGAYGSGVGATLDILHTAATLAPTVKWPAPSWRVVSPDGGSVALGRGLHVDTAALPRRVRDDASTWVVPGMGVDDPAEIARRLAHDDAQRAIAALQRHVARGGAVAASCSSVFVLQAAGLLRGRRVTTSWWLAPALRRLEPDCVVDADRMVCADGPLTTAGAAFAQSDLMLHLLRARFGIALADVVSRVLLIDGRAAQAPFVIPAMLANGDELVRRLTQRIEKALPDLPGIAALAEAFAMSPRTLARRVHAATGCSALALVQSVRLNRARALIETSRLTIDEVAARVGYADATALRRLMRKQTGVTPGRFRPGVYAG